MSGRAKCCPQKGHCGCRVHCMHVCSPPRARSNTLGSFRLRLASSLGKRPDLMGVGTHIYVVYGVRMQSGWEEVWRVWKSVCGVHRLSNVV